MEKPQLYLQGEQERYDEAALRIAEIASRFCPAEAIGVIDLARARLSIRNAVSDRITSEVREKNRP